MKNVIKETQGNRKIKQYLEDLKRNKFFKKELRRYFKLENKATDNLLNHVSTKEDKIIGYFLNKYIKLYSALKRVLKKHYKNDYLGIGKKFAEQYALDSTLIDSLLSRKYLSKDDSLMIDMCSLTDNVEENGLDWEHDFLKGIPLALHPSRQNHFISYPVSIDIHRFATKRDVIDYVEKRWERIENMLGMERDKPVRIKKRKHDRKMLDFLWENKDMDIHKLKNILNEKFPENGLVYYEIYQLVRLERKRRTERIIVGQ